jgi:hypothetical protein
VKDAIDTAISRSCTGKIDVLGHSSNLWKQNRSFTYNNLGHFGLQKYTSTRQYYQIR